MVDVEQMHKRSLELINKLIDGHKYTYKMFRGKFIRELERLGDNEFYAFWFDGENFFNMRLYKYLVELGFKRHGTVLERDN